MLFYASYKQASNARAVGSKQTYSLSYREQFQLDFRKRNFSCAIDLVEYSVDPRREFSLFHLPANVFNDVNRVHRSFIENFCQNGCKMVIAEKENRHHSTEIRSY